MKDTIKFVSLVVFGVALLTMPLYSQEALTGSEILRRMDANETFGTIAYSATMTIDLGHRVLHKEMKTVAESDKKAYVEFINPEDQGTRYLKIEDEMWMYFPREQDTVKISGHLLKEGMMGSDVSYEDALENGKLEDSYTVEVLGQETVDGRAAWVLDLQARTKTAPYNRQKLWIDAERYVGIKAEMFAKSCKLIKESQVLEIQRFGERWFPTKSRVENKLRKGNGTIFEMTNIEFDKALPNNMFTLRRLTR
ncbi:MAG TPA: outer membrane lipoprotein-sorting protein [Treponema sp.]|nr:outer membrane lipoprotein-sorting protein [Treponema sp.]